MRVPTQNIKLMSNDVANDFISKAGAQYLTRFLEESAENEDM